MDPAISTSSARDIVRHLRSTQTKIYADSPILKRLGNLFLRYEIGFFEAFGKYNGFGILGGILLDTNDKETKECVLRILMRAMEGEGDVIKLSIILTMTMMPIPYFFKSEEDLSIIAMTLEFLTNMFVHFTFVEHRNKEHYLDYKTIQILKGHMASLLVVIQLPLLNENDKIALKAIKLIGLFTRLRFSKVNLEINNYLNEPGYNRIIDLIFSKRGEALSLQVYLGLIRSTERASEPFFTEENMQRLKEAMIRSKLKHSLFFVLFKKCAYNALRPHIKLIFDSGVIEVLKSVVANREGKYSEFNRVQAMESINRLMQYLNAQQARIFINRPFFKGLNEILKKNKHVRNKLSVLQIIHNVLRHEWNQAIRKKSKNNPFAKFAMKQKIYKTLLQIKGIELKRQKALRTKATEIFSFYFTESK